MTEQEMNITDGKMIHELRKMQAQIIHGTKFFGEVADRIEALQNSLEAAKRDTEIVDGLIALAKRTQVTISYSFNSYVDLQLQSGECFSSFTDLRRALESAMNAERKENL